MTLGLNNIYEVIRIADEEGRPKDSIVMLLVNFWELQELMRSFPQSVQKNGTPAPNECMIFGVRVIGVEGIPCGSITKIFDDTLASELPDKIGMILTTKSKEIIVEDKKCLNRHSTDRRIKLD